jgi:type IV pilus assembly protein PilC
MPVFQYNATKNDRLSKGRVTFGSEADARRSLTQDGFSEIALVPIKNTTSLVDRLFRRVTLVQRLFFTQNLEVMIRTGFSLSLALQTLGEQATNKHFKAVILDLTENVKSGVSFSTALEKHSSVFSDIFVSMIAAGEASGKLEEVLKRLTIQLKKDHQLVAKVKNALTYPIIVVVAMVGIGIAVSIFVIPKLTVVFVESNVELPLPTKILMGFSDVLIHYGYLIALGAIGLGFVFARLLRRPKVRRTVDRVTLRLPIVGMIVKKIHLARFARTLSSLLETDIHIVESFQIIAKTLSNSIYRSTVEEAAEQLKTGTSIAKVLGKEPGLFPPLLLQMITVGEQSGSLDQISSEIAEFYEADVDDTMGNLSTIIEPALMLTLGIAVAIMAVAIIQPIYSLTETI